MKLILTFTLLFLSSCFFSEDGKIEINPLNSSFGTSNAQVSSVSIVNDQLVVNGSGLSGITKVQITGPSSFDHTFSIESKSDSNLIANGVSNIAFALDAIFSLTVTDANGSATYSVTFTLQDDAVTTSKILDGAVTAAKLSDMGAGTGQVLKYNGTTWVPGDLNALTYAGTWDASTATAPNVAPTAGEYYIVSVAAAGIDISDGSGSRNFVLGDWLVYNGTTTRWDKIDNASYVTSFNGRTGAVTPATNDYTWAQIDKSASVLSNINDVEAPAGDGSDTGKVLKWNNATSTWELGDDLSGGGAGSVTSTEIADGSITNDDVNAAAAIAYSKLNIADGDLTIAKTSGLQTALNAKLNLAGGTMTGDLTMGANNIITSGNVDGVDVSTLATSVSTNTSTIAGLDTDDITEATNQYFTNARAIAAPITGFTSGAGTVAATDTVLQAIQKLDGNVTALDTDDVTEATSLYHTTARARTAAVVNSTAGTETDQAASVSAMKTYVAAQVSGAGAVLADGSVAMTGNLDLGNNQLRLKSDNTNYVQMIAPNSLAATYTLTMPADDGTSGQVLSTNGTGTLSWVSPASGSVTSVTGTAPIVSSGGTTPAISIAQANGSTDGFLDSADWTTFNNKQAAITTGTTAQYLRGDLSLSTFGTDVIGSAITGFTSGAGTVAATDTVLQAVQKLDGNIAANTSTISGLDTDDITEATNQYFTNARAIAAPITGFTSGAGTVAATDTVLQAIQKLDGNIAAAGDILDGGNTTGSAVTIGTNDAQSLNLETNNSTAMTILSSGNVGIGTTNPTTKAHIHSTSATTYFKITANDTGTGGADGLDIIVNDSTYTTPYQANILQRENAPLAFWTNNAERFRVDADGNVGVGTSSPSSNLDLQGNLSNSLTGTVTVGAGTAAVTGSGTAFTTELAVGDAISISGETFTVQAIGSATALTLDSNHVAGATGVAATSDPNLVSVKTGDASEVFTVNSEGKVGVGTASPSYKLDVAGEVTLGSQRNWAIRDNNAGSQLAFEYHNGATLNDSNIKMVVNSNGRVGVGTITPSTALEVNGTVTATAFAGDGSALTGISATGVAAGAGTVGAPSMSFSTDTNTGFYSSGADQIGVSANGTSIFDFTATGLTSPTTGGSHITTGNGTAAAPTFSFAGDTDTGWYRAAADTLAAATAGSERVRIDSSGNMGIGTTSPQRGLHVKGSINNTPVVIDATSTSDGDSVRLAFRDYNGAGDKINSQIGGVVENFASAYSGLNFYTKGSDGVQERVRIDEAGNVGIGTTSPSSDLHIARGDTNSPKINLVDSDGATGYIQAANNDLIVAAQSNHGVKFRTNDTDVMRILNNGNVGIGTTAPSKSLHVVSSDEAALFEGSATWGSAIQIDATGTSGRNFQLQSTAAAAGEGAGKFLIVDKDASQTRLTVDSSGNVGIGTTSPSSLLHVNGDAIIGGTLSVGGDNVTVADSYHNGRNAFSDKQIFNPLSENILYSADRRFTVTSTGVSPVLTSALFDAYFEESNSNVISAGGTGVINIDLVTKGEYTSTGVIYPQGYLYLSFYHTSGPDSVSGRVKNNSGVWSAMTNAEEVASGSNSLWRLQMPGNAYATEVEVTINAPAGSNAALTEIEWVGSRASTAIVSGVYKNIANDMHKEMSWVDSSNQTQASIETTGNAHFTGSVGIGTASPLGNFHVQSSGAQTEAYITNTGSGSATLILDASNGDGAGGDYFVLRQNDDLSAEINMPSSAGSFHITTGGGTALTVNQSADVGIGTTSPSSDLHIHPASGSDTVGGAAGLKFTVADDAGPGWNLRVGDTTDDGDFNIDGQTGGSWTNYLNIDRSTGNILAKNGSIGTNKIFGSASDTTTNRAWLDGTGYIWSTMDSSAASYNLYLQRSTTNHGFAAFYYGTSLVGSMTTNGTSTAYNTTSDKRLKENLKKLDSPMERLNQIEVYEYNYISKPEEVMDGFLAQQLKDVVPYAVTGEEIPLEEDDEDGDGLPDHPMAVDYSKIVPLLTASLQEVDKNLKMFKLMQEGIDSEQNRKIASLESEVAQLKAENEKVKSTNERIEQENAEIKKQLDDMKSAVCSINPNAKICQ